MEDHWNPLSLPTGFEYQGDYNTMRVVLPTNLQLDDDFVIPT